LSPATRGGPTRWSCTPAPAELHRGTG
jgi:hypothetical protein